jgi:hypothetical protein
MPLASLVLVVIFYDEKDIFGNDDKKIRDVLLVLEENGENVEETVKEKFSSLYPCCKYSFVRLKCQHSNAWKLDKKILLNFLPYLIKEKLIEFDSKANHQFPMG